MSDYHIHLYDVPESAITDNFDDLLAYIRAHQDEIEIELCDDDEAAQS